VQRVWRLVNEALPFIGGVTGPAIAAHVSPSALALRRQVHKTLAAVEDDIERLAFNRAVARIYELVNAIFRVLNDTDVASDATMPGALSEAFDVLIQIIQPMMPHLAEESWATLGREGLLALSAWPIVDRALTIDDTIVLPVQINGKKRAELTLPRDMSDKDVEAAALALDVVRDALAGRAPRKVIVVPQRIVNVVA